MFRFPYSRAHAEIRVDSSFSCCPLRPCPWQLPDPQQPSPASPVRHLRLDQAAHCRWEHTKSSKICGHENRLLQPQRCCFCLCKHRVPPAEYPPPDLALSETFRTWSSLSPGCLIWSTAISDHRCKALAHGRQLAELQPSPHRSFRFETGRRIQEAFLRRSTIWRLPFE